MEMPFAKDCSHISSRRQAPNRIVRPFQFSATRYAHIGLIFQSFKNRIKIAVFNRFRVLVLIELAEGLANVFGI